jgi:hypothetical protein
MQITPTHYREWRQASRCTLGAVELVVVSEIGPRILSLRWRGGPNLLYEDTSGFGVGDWRLYGGHRFTVAPEGDESYAADNRPCLVEPGAQELRISSPIGAAGTRRSLIITSAVDGEGFDLCHELKNEGQRPWSGALWAVTCVPQAGVVAPRATANIRFWPGTNPGDWNLAPDHVPSVPRFIRGKIGWHSDPAWLASLQAEATLVIHNPEPPLANQCVDGGCNVEIFTCPEYVELETLGGQMILPPGGRALHRQRWRLLEPGFAPKDWAVIARQAGCAATQ